MNPCQCWYLTDDEKECTCSFNSIKNYTSRLSGPLLDRIDIFIEVPRVKTDKFKISEDYNGRESSKDIYFRVKKSREIQLSRFKNLYINSNSEMQTKEINKYCCLNDESNMVIKQAINSMKLSARAYYRILKLSRTIADLQWKENIETNHILEALSFRKQEKE